MRNIVISLTSIFQRQHILLKVIKALMKQTIFNDNYIINNKHNICEKPKIELQLSENEYLLDKGFPNKEITNLELLSYLKVLEDNQILSINWVDNTGPYRKLLHTLKKYNNNSTYIITLDDDMFIYEPLYLENLINTFFIENNINNKSDNNIIPVCIGYRGFTLNNETLQYKLSNSSNLSKTKTLWNFSTNGAGTIWHNSMLYSNNEQRDLFFNIELIKEYASTADDIWFNMFRIYNNCELMIINPNNITVKNENNNITSKKYKIPYKLLTDKVTALYFKYNMIINNTGDDKNSIVLRNVNDLLKKKINLL